MLGNGGNDLFLIILLLCCCGCGKHDNGCGCYEKKGCDCSDLLTWYLLLNCCCGGGRDTCCK